MYLSLTRYELETEPHSPGKVAVIIPSRETALEHLFRDYRWSVRIPRIEIRYTPSNITFRFGQNVIFNEEDIARWNDRWLELMCHDMDLAKPVTRKDILAQLNFLGISGPKRETFTRYHFTNGFVVLWDYDSECYVMSRMPDLSSIIEPADLETCRAEDEKFETFMRGRGL